MNHFADEAQQRQYAALISAAYRAAAAASQQEESSKQAQPVTQCQCDCGCTYVFALASGDAYKVDLPNGKVVCKTCEMACLLAEVKEGE